MTPCVSVARLTLLAAGFFLLCAGPARPDDGQPKPTLYAVREALDIRYHDGSERQRLDVLSPWGLDKAPVILFVHGGAWTIGDKNLFGFYRGVGRFLAEHGYVTVLTNYRLSPAVKHPEHIKDIARAFAWTRRHVGEYGGDPDRIILCGHSAGGHLVALLATDEAYLKDPALKLNDEDRAAIKGVIGVSGVYRVPGPGEFRGMSAEMLNGLMRRGGVKPVEALVTSSLLAPSLKGFNPIPLAFGDDPAVRKQASPITHVRAGLPPFLLLYAEKDLPRLPEMAKDFAKALADAGNRVEEKQIDNTDHNFILFSLAQPDDPAAAAILKFLAAVTPPPPREKTP